MKYVKMDESHVAQVALLEQACFSDPWSEKAISSELTNPLSCWIVALDGETLTGYVGSQSVLGWADMMNLAVAVDYRRRGVAEQLVYTLIDNLKSQDVTCLTLEVRASNQPAIKLYEKLGFSQVGRRPNYYHNPKEDALIMRREWDV